MDAPVQDAAVGSDAGLPQAGRERPNLKSLTVATGRLIAVGPSVQALLSLAPEVACDLGFDRVLLSRVEEMIWRAELMFSVGDPVWAEEIVAAGRSRPPLLESLPEAGMVRDHQPILVTGVRLTDDARLGNQVMAQASHTRSYVAAPIVSGGQMIGMLHADCYGQRRDVDEIDRDLLAAFAQMFSLALDRAAVVERLSAIQEAVAGGVGGVLVPEVRPTIRVARSEGRPADELVIRTRPRAADPLIDSLTPRELEVLRLLALGYTNTVVARELSIAEDTAKQHVKHLLRKLQAGNRSAAVARYFQSGAGQS